MITTWPETFLPATALPGSGSKGRPVSRTSQPAGSPAIFIRIIASCLGSTLNPDMRMKEAVQVMRIEARLLDMILEKPARWSL
jgi:hypothetical protein